MASGSGSVARHKPWKHDVFLSFRGEDTRLTFTSHLFECLEEKGVNTFIDNNLPKGEDIGSELIDTIRSSRISVIVLSSNYAESRWCLQELSEIMECRKKSPGQVVLPVFYDVSPSDVRKQTGPFEKHFAKHEQDRDRETVARWKAALLEAGSLSGWDITNSANGPEANIVRRIARRICDELNHTYLDVAKYPVGLECRMSQVNEYLHDGSDDVRFIVIWGMGGIGKTTLAKAVYNQFFHTFEAKCFLANVSENAKQQNGLVQLQQQLLYDVLKFQEIHIENIYRGATVIKERLRNRRVLVVLDDVTHRDQLNALAREREWFGSGSRIIITTRDPDSVKEIKAEHGYPLKALNNDESLELFSRHAFGNSHPQEEFIELSRAVVCYCQGLPLALEVLGAFLFDQSVREWKSALERLGKIPHNDIQKKFEISFQALGCDNDKELFLDIACFFVGWDKDAVLQILDACREHAESGISVLSRRNLIKIVAGNNRLEMHDMVRDMGREIVRRESPRNPGNRSRLFSDCDILATLQNQLGTNAVEGLVWISSMSARSTSMEKVDAKAFEGMRRLRLLMLDGLDVDGDYRVISKVRWLRWRGFSRNFLPDGFYMENLVIIDMQHSKLRDTWKASTCLRNLKVLNLSHSHFLTKTPDFSKTQNLEELIMEDCRDLKEVDGSIGLLERLVLLILKDCKKLKSLPDGICRAKSLRALDISGCSCINRLPDDFGGLESLTEFLANGAPIDKLPLSFSNLKNLSKLSLYGYNTSKPSSISGLIWSWVSKIVAPQENNRPIGSLSGLRSLTVLRLVQCNLSNDGLLEGIGSLLSLRELRIKRNDFRCLPGSISYLSSLELVKVKECPMLESLPDMPKMTKDRLSLVCRDCPRLVEISNSYAGNWNRSFLLSMQGCKNLSAKCIQSLLMEPPGNCYDKLCCRLLYVPGSNIPEWFEYQSVGASLSFRFPVSCGCEPTKIIVSYVAPPNSDSQLPSLSLTVESTSSQFPHPILYFITETTSKRTGDHIGIFSVAPSMIMGDVRYPDRGSIRVALDIESDPRLRWTGKGVGVHLEGGKKCPICCLNNANDAEAGSYCGHCSKEDLEENERESADSTVDQRWHLKFFFSGDDIPFYVFGLLAAIAH